MIDWQADLEKKVANLLRQFDAEVRAHGDELIVTVTVETAPVNPPSKSPPATQGETSDGKDATKASKRKK